MNHFTLNLNKIEQFNSSIFYFSTLSFKYLNKTARLNSRASSENEDGYQREFSKSRLKNISDYINDSIDNSELDIPIFPTPIVLAIESSQEINDLKENKFDEKSFEENISPYFNLIKSKNFLDEDIRRLNSKHYEDKQKVISKYKLTIEDVNILENVPLSLHVDDKLILPLTLDSIFIVDGQHRFKGMQKLYNDLLNENNKQNNDEKIKKIENFEFVVSILLDFDIYQQSRVFANINFNQKSVNKSLYYDIFGSIFKDRDELTFVHYLVKSLNETENFQNIIKMLGTGSGTISLAFFVETILDNLIDKSLKKYISEYLNETGHLYMKLPVFLENYFLYFKNNFIEYFPKFELRDDNTNIKIFKSSNYKHFLFKTTGIYGLLNLINDLYTIEKTIFLMNKEELSIFLSNTLNKNSIDALLKNEKYLNTAGKALQKNFYSELKKCINKI